jgi:S1-C subfamily serine protease
VTNRLNQPVRIITLGTLAILFVSGLASAQPSKSSSLAGVAEKVNQKMVKLFGVGGFRGITAYGTGIVVSPDGYVLTSASPMLDTNDLLIHLYDGRRLHGKVVITEPELDAALVKIDKAEDLPFFDISKEVQKPRVQPGDWVLAFSNQFEIATREEPMSVQHGVIAAFNKLQGRRGIFEAPYSGEVYVIDAITNNPGAGGGAVTTLKGDLIGIVGKELQNKLSDTWVNYAVPIQVLGAFVEKGRRGEYKQIVKPKQLAGPAGYHGLILVPNVVERTPPFVEETTPNSPAARAGFKPDDLIVYLDGEKITSIKEFRDVVDKSRPGTAFKVEVRRGDKLTTIELKLEPLPTAAKK